MGIGITGSVAHVATNKNLSKKDKAACYTEQYKEGLKDTAKFTAVAGAAAGVGAIASKSGKFVNALKSVRHTVGEALSKVDVSGTNLKDAVKNSKVYTKFSSLPTPAKAAIAVGSAVVALGAPIFGLSQSAKAGYIEGKHEEKCGCVA